MALLNGLLDRLLANHQEALLLSPGRPPRYRTDGAEIDAAAFELDDTIILELLEEVSPTSVVPDAPTGLRHQFVRRHRGVELGFAATATAEGWSLAVGPLPKEQASDDDSPPAPISGSLTSDSPAAGSLVADSLVADSLVADSLVADSTAPDPLTPDPLAPDLLRPALPAPSEGPAPSQEPETPVVEPATGKAPSPLPAPGSVQAPASAARQAAAVPACTAAVVCPAATAGSHRLPAIDELLAAMLQRGASDLHLSSGQHPWLRLDGELSKIDEWSAPDSAELTTTLARLMPTRNREQFEATNDTDFAHEIAGLGRFRINVFRERQGVGAVFRHIPITPPSFEELGLPSVLRALTKLPKGLVLVTGPTGSGKSTTLASLIHLINRSRRDHIITIEDPIEFVHQSDQCMVTQREVGPHTGSFHHALRAALREDPDIVLVGEMRDLETMSTAIHTAETGHVVFGTLHTTSAPSTVERVIGQFPRDLQGQIRLMLADSLRAVISQTLLRKIGGGRVAAFEVLLGTPAVSNLIREGKTFQIASTMQTGKGIGMRTLADSLFSLVTEGIVEPAEAYRKAVFKEALAGKFDAAGIRLEGRPKSELAA
jgi:twitching motility protein PilT